MLDRYGDVLTVKEVCTILRIGRNKAYELLEKKQIAYIRIGRTYRIPKESLLAYLHIQVTNEGCAPTSSGVQ